MMSYSHSSGNTDRKNKLVRNDRVLCSTVFQTVEHRTQNTRR